MHGASRGCRSPQYRHYRATVPSPNALVIDVDGIGVRLSSPDRPVFPGVTKRQLFDYYLGVGPDLLVHVAGRPTGLERWPDGVYEGAEHFYGKHLPKNAPEYVRGIDIRFPSGRSGHLLDPTSRAAIGWAVQLGAICLHAWPVTAPVVDRPDQLRIDLDPSPGNDFAQVRDVALTAREVLTGLGLVPFVKTSGSRGLHVFAPIHAEYGFVDVRHAAIAVGRMLERRLPDAVTTSWWKEERGNRVFVDFNQNAQDRLMASAYSVRPLPHAPVSTPVTWEELPGIDPATLTVHSVPARLADRGDPWAAMRSQAASLAPALAAWDADVDAGLPELPYPPDFPKMPGEPPRVQPSRARFSR